MKITINKKMKLRIEPRKVGETKKAYREYIEDCFYEQFPKKICTGKMLDKIERASYNYSYDHDRINFCGNGVRGLVEFFSREKQIKKENKETKKEVKEIKKETKETKKEVKEIKKETKETKKENKVVGFFKNLFKRKDKVVENEDVLEETFDEVFDENIHEDDIIFEENIHEEDMPKVEKKPEIKEEKTTSLPIEIKSSRDLNKEEVSNISVMAQLRYLQQQNKKQEEIINSTINNFNVYLENFKKLEQENLKLRREITRLSYNPNSFVVRNAYEEAVKEDKIRTKNKIYNSLINDTKEYIHDDLTANQYNVDRVKVLTRK